MRTGGNTDKGPKCVGGIKQSFLGLKGEQQRRSRNTNEIRDKINGEKGQRIWENCKK
jgi:hypothetical protein